MPAREVRVVTLTVVGSLSDEQFDAWASALYAKTPEAMLSQSAGQIRMTLWLDDAGTHLEALRQAEELLAALRAPAHFTVVGVEVSTESLYAREAERSTLPELVGVPEVADILGISRQRVHQLKGTPRFPAPLARLKGRSMWDAAVIRIWAEKRR